MSSPTVPDEEWVTSVIEIMAGQKGVTDVIVLTGDGLMLGATTAQADQGDAEGCAAAASGILSCGKAIASKLTGGQAVARQAVVETDEGFVVALPAGENAYLLVHTDTSTDLGLVTYEAKRLVKRLGERVLASAPRDRIT
ncbi:putative regulator of Ras-like GTPase activity (Roadblock/LC7/MglB family) [Streptacidiphilus sp. BW17]|uniref:roadblock/LC7 domain-containing protein n=1 Tax=Streptacidiphilus sp. BW17 TaxID=3156274 RepID=UPI0035184F98